ncbi:MAG: iron transporter [Ancrocorticia sp.]|uniref:iron transporter n=1 Tax=Ancrocorticia sp. TaxID=2593684 RepID=UPI003F93ABB9
MKNKKFLALLAGTVMAFSLSACSSDDGDASESTDEATVAASEDDAASEEDPDTTGINELPVGDSGPQTDGPLTVDLVYFQAIDLEQGSLSMPPASESDMHFEVDVATTEEATEWGYEADEFLPYLNIKAVVTNTDTGEETDLGTMMPMIASDGAHYGNNISLEPGNYNVELTVTSPADDFMLHTGKDSSGVKGRFWSEPLTFEFENWQWDGQLI